MPFIEPDLYRTSYGGKEGKEEERNIWPFGDGEKVMFYLFSPSIFAQPSFLVAPPNKGEKGCLS